MNVARAGTIGDRSPEWEDLYRVEVPIAVTELHTTRSRGRRARIARPARDLAVTRVTART